MSTLDRMVDLLPRWIANGTPSTRLLCGRCGRVMGRGVPDIPAGPPFEARLVLGAVAGRDYSEATERALERLRASRRVEFPGLTIVKGLRMTRPPVESRGHIGRYRLDCKKCGTQRVVLSTKLGAAWTHEVELHGQCSRLIIGQGPYATEQGVPHL